MGATQRVTFRRDFRSAATGEQFYTAGATVSLPAWAVGVLLAEGVVSLAAPTQTTLPETGAVLPPAAPVVRAARKTAVKKVKRGTDE